MKWFLTSLLLSVAAVTFLLWTRLSNQEVSFIPADSLKVSEEQRPPYIDDSHLLVRTNACTIYQWPVFPLDTMLLFERQPEKPNCSSFRLEDAIHRINFTSVYLPPTLIDCKAFELSRKADDFWNNNKKLLWKQNAQSVSSKSHQILHFEGAENVFIKCKGMLTDEENEQQKVVPLIPLKTPKVWPESLPKLAFKVKNLYPQTNIVFIGIDSLSRLNFLRQMRKTAAFLEEHHFQTFYGHHKVGTNTRPNLFAMMLGISPAEYQARLPPSKLLDDYAFISKDFSTGGYLTSMIEDYFPYVLFEFDGAEGFTPDNYPMDYNIDPLGRNIRHSSRFKFESACYGNRLQVEYYLDLLLDQMAAFRARKQPHLIWSHFSGLTHDHFNGAQNFDRPFLKLMQNIFARGYSNDTVLVFYSDHHNRLSPEVSKLGSHHHESNLPQMAIWVPESLRLLTEDGGEGLIDGKQVRAVMKANSRQLTSMFDVYSTLQHLLYGRPVAHPKGVSLFTPISPTRSCSQAGIPPQYCQCTEYRNFEDAAMAAAIAECLIKYINEKKVPSLQYPLCGRLQLGEVVSVRRYLHDNALEEHGLLLGMRFKAAPPSGALFEASVQVNSTDMTSLTAITANKSISMSDLQLYGEIDRLDRYREQSACVAGTEAERFCYCLPSA